MAPEESSSWGRAEKVDSSFHVCLSSANRMSQVTKELVRVQRPLSFYARFLRMGLCGSLLCARSTWGWSHNVAFEIFFDLLDILSFLKSSALNFPTAQKQQ